MEFLSKKYTANKYSEIWHQIVPNAGKLVSWCGDYLRCRYLQKQNKIAYILINIQSPSIHYDKSSNLGGFNLLDSKRASQATQINNTLKPIKVSTASQLILFDSYVSSNKNSIVLFNSKSISLSAGWPYGDNSFAYAW